MSGSVWLTLSETNGSGVSIEVDRDVAWTLDRKGFETMYKRHVLGGKRRDRNKAAREWADKMIAEREEARLRWDELG